MAKNHESGPVKKKKMAYIVCMSFFSSQRNSCYCAFCKNPRKLYIKKNIDFSHILASLLLSLVLMFVIWHDFDPRFLALFVSFLFAAEIFVHLRWRVALVCRHCGFDPALYLKNPEKTVEKVKLHLERRKVETDFLLSPKLNLSFRKIEKISPRSTRLPLLNADQNKLLNTKNQIEASKKGRLISKSV
jgi:hypothetical protein